MRRRTVAIRRLHSLTPNPAVNECNGDLATVMPRMFWDIISNVKRNASMALTLAALVLGCGCAKKTAAPPPPPPPETILGSESNAPQYSLFKGDQTVLSDQDIGKILNTRLSLA